MRLPKYIALPPTVTNFERRYLARLNKVALYFFLLHIPVLMLVAWAAGTGPLKALVLSGVVMVGPLVAYRSLQNPRAVSVVYGITAMLTGALLVHFGQGPVQIEMHFYFFALLAMLCMFANPMVNLVAAGTVAVHHLVVWWLLPSSVFNYDAQWWVVLVHAAFVVLETVAACYISREFFDNVIGLEKIVEARTATIREKQRDMRLILDNVESGLITIDLFGHMSSECSRVVEEWLGTPVAGEKLADWMSARDHSFAEWLDLSLESVRDGMLPMDVALGQLPRTLKDRGRTYSVNYQLIVSADDDMVDEERRHEERTEPASAPTPAKILVILTDVTERLLSEAKGRHQAELLTLFQHITKDKSGFVEFLVEAEEIVAALRQAHYDSLDGMKRLIHTLKGNAAIFGMGGVADVCHILESQISEEGTAPGPEQLGVMFDAWERVRGDLKGMLGEHAQGGIDFDDADYETILQAVLDGEDSQAVATMLRALRYEPTAKRLARAQQQIEGLAGRLGKGDVRVVVESNGLRLDRDHFQPFWSEFVHVLRNTVDHGVDEPYARQLAGKSAQPSILLATAVEGNELVVSVQDDGPGIDWERLAAKAQSLGITVDSEAKIRELIFASGVSAKDSVTEMSGRGVGMGAVRDACVVLGGSVTVESTRGQGTRMSFRFPKKSFVYAGHSATVARPSAAVDTVAPA